MLILTTDQKAGLGFTAYDAAGNIAEVESPTWISSDEEIISVMASEDGMNAEVVAQGKSGTAQVLLEVDTKIGEEVHPLQGVLDVQVLAGEAVSLSIQAGMPEPK